MGLKNIHAGLITMASLLGLFLGLWCAQRWSTGSGTLLLVAAFAAFAASAGAIAYVVWFLRKMNAEARERTSRLYPAAAVWLFAFAPDVAQACSVCFGDPNSPMVKGASAGVWFLLAVVVAIEAAFATFFFVYLRKRTRLSSNGALEPHLELVKSSGNTAS